MSYRRYDIQLAIPLTNGKVPKKLQGQIVAIEEHIRVLKSFAVKINEGMANEEDTVKATRHICHHDEPNNTIGCNETEVEI